MHPHLHSLFHIHRIRFVATSLLAAVLVLAGCATADSTGEASTGAPEGNTISATEIPAGPSDDAVEPRAPVEPPVTATSGAADQSPDHDQPPAEFPTGIVPLRIEIPSIGVDAPVVELDLRGETPEVPEDFADTGWYQQTRLPGEIGPAVIAGHVDSVDGPAVFARLSLLEPGDEITVTGADGDRRVFVVADTGQYPKTDLPDQVFGFGEPVPELRLITCGGTFDRSVRHYVDNFVVYAVSSSQSPSAL